MTTRQDRGPYPETIGDLAISTILAELQRMDAEAEGGISARATMTYAVLDRYIAATDRLAKRDAEPVFIVDFEHLTAKDPEFPDEAQTTGATVIGRANFDLLMEIMQRAGWRATDITERQVTPPSDFTSRAALTPEPEGG